MHIPLRSSLAAFALFVGMASLSAETDLISNGDFSEPINTGRKRGVWMLLVNEVSGASFNLALDGFTVENNTLSMDMDRLKVGGGESAMVIQLSQLIVPLVSGRQYRLSFDLKGSLPEGAILVGVGIVLAGQMQGGLEWQEERPETLWRPHTYEFTATDVPGGKPGATRLDFRIGKAVGVLSLKDVKLVQLD
jgi:hypothetical protein